MLTIERSPIGHDVATCAAGQVHHAEKGFWSVDTELTVTVVVTMAPTTVALGVGASCSMHKQTKPADKQLAQRRFIATLQLITNRFRPLYRETTIVSTALPA